MRGRSLRAYINQMEVGTLQEVDDLWSFEYATDWLGSPRGYALSPHLPLTAETLLDGASKRPIHPGEVLREEFLIPLGLSASALALALQVPAPRINDIVRERRAVTADTALRLSQYFGTSVDFWMALQTDYDTAKARHLLVEVLPRIPRHRTAATA